MSPCANSIERMLAAKANGTATVLKMSVLTLLKLSLFLLLISREEYDTTISLGFRWLIKAINEISRSRGDIGGDLLSLAGRDIFLQSSQESGEFHSGRYFTYP